MPKIDPVLRIRNFESNTHSRAKCSAILVASPGVFDAQFVTLRQIQLVNSFYRYLETCKTIKFCLPTLFSQY